MKARCAVCSRPLVDEASIAFSIGPDCRRAYKYDDVIVTPEERAEAHGLLREIAEGRYDFTTIYGAIRRLAEIGFVLIAERIDQRFGSFDAGIAVDDTPELPHEELERVVAAANPLPDVNPTEGQTRALEAVRRLDRKRGFGVVFIVGFAGVGKTTMIRMIAKEFDSLHVVTPTGKAAVRVREATRLMAETVHRWMYYPKPVGRSGRITFKRRSQQDLHVKRFLVLDEASMIGPDIWKDLHAACVEHEIKLVCIGDGFQLPPVQPRGEAPFSILEPEFAARLGAERIEMTEVLRQAKDSPVVRASMLLRQGYGARAFSELPRISPAQFYNVAVQTYKHLGVIICHRNITRFKLNANIRYCLGIQDDLPRAGEPLLVLKNNYALGLFNGESIPFPGWGREPAESRQVLDEYANSSELARFGTFELNGAENSNVVATLCVEELYGRLSASPYAVGKAASDWSEAYNFGANTPHLHANFGYVYTAHRSQGSQWPYVLAIIEPSVRLNEDDGQRWAYTAITRAEKNAAVYFGNI